MHLSTPPLKQVLHKVEQFKHSLLNLLEYFAQPLGYVVVSQQADAAIHYPAPELAVGSQKSVSISRPPVQFAAVVFVQSAPPYP